MPGMTVDLIAEESPKQRAAGDGTTTLALITFFSLSLFGTSHLLSVSGGPDYVHCHLILQPSFKVSIVALGEEMEAQDAK